MADSQSVADALARVNERLNAVNAADRNASTYIRAVGEEVLNQVSPPPPPPPAEAGLPWWVQLIALGALGWATVKFGPNILGKLGLTGGKKKKGKKRR